MNQKYIAVATWNNQWTQRFSQQLYHLIPILTPVFFAHLGWNPLPSGNQDNHLFLNVFSAKPPSSPSNKNQGDFPVSNPGPTEWNGLPSCANSRLKCSCKTRINCWPVNFEKPSCNWHGTWLACWTSHAGIYGWSSPSRFWPIPWWKEDKHFAKYLEIASKTRQVARSDEEFNEINYLPISSVSQPFWWNSIGMAYPRRMRAENNYWQQHSTHIYIYIYIYTYIYTCIYIYV